MGRWALPILLLLGILAALFALANPEWLGSDDGAEAPAPVTPGEARDPLPVRDEQLVADIAPAAPAAPAALVPAATPEVSATLAWHGRVVNAAGEPLPGAQILRVPAAKSVVTFSHGPAPEDLTLLQRALSCASTATGEFTLPWEQPPENVKWVLLVRHPEAVSHLVACKDALESGGDCGTLQLAPGCIARGRVLCADGTPAVGADVEARITPYTARVYDGDVQHIVGLREGLLRTTTDAEGGFLLAGLPSASLGLELQHVGHAPRRAEPFALTPGTTCEIGDVRLERGGIVAGRVLDEAGRPVAGAEVRGFGTNLDYLRRFEHGVHLLLESARTGGWDRSGRPAARACVASTDAQGRFEVGGLTQALCGVVAAVEGFEPVVLEDVPVGSRDLLLRLRRVGRLRLRIVDALERSVVADAELQIQRVWDAEADASESGESLVVERVAPGEFLVLGVCDAPLIASVRSPAWGLVGVRLAGLEPGKDEESRELALQLPVSITGRVVDSAGAPLATAKIRFAPYSSDSQPLPFQWNQADVGPDGRFRLGPMPADKWVVVAHDADRAPSQYVRELAAGESADLSDLVLPRMACVEARLLGVQGEPLSGVDVNLVAADRPLGGAMGLASARTDAEGRARMLVAPGAVRIGARLKMLGQDLGTLAEAEVRSVVLQQQLPMRLSGTVRSGGAPVAGARVQFTHPFGTVSTKSDDGGGFLLEAPVGLGGTLFARSPRGGIVSRLVEASAGGSPVVDLSFDTQRVRGRVLQRSTGAGMPGASVQAWTEEPRMVGATVKVADDGSFELADMSAGTWVVQAFGEGLSFSEQGTVTLPAAAPSEIVLQVDRVGSVSGSLRTDGGATPSRFSVGVYLLRTTGDEPPTNALPEEDGRFLFKDVLPGEYLLIATRGSRGHERPWHDRETVEQLAWLRIPVRVAPGQSAQQDVILPPGRP